MLILYGQQQDISNDYLINWGSYTTKTTTYYALAFTITTYSLMITLNNYNTVNAYQSGAFYGTKNKGSFKNTYATEYKGSYIAVGY